MTFIFDTGSAWTWIPSSDCPDDQCTNRHYEYMKSTGFRSTGRREQVIYGIGEIAGYVVNDDVAITSDPKTMATDVNFINVFQAKNLSSLKSDGLLGLSPKTSRVGAQSRQEVHLLVEELKKDGVIKNSVFSIYLTTYDRQSRMYFGGYL